MQCSGGPGHFHESHHIISMSKSRDLVYGVIVMDLISCFGDVVNSERSAENNVTLQMV